MSEKKKRGRPSKNDSNSSYAIIRDPLMEPYFIQKDRYNYTVMERVTPTVGFAGKEPKGKELERPIAYMTSFKSAIWRISQLKFTNESKGEYNSIKEYIDEWKDLKDGIYGLLNKIKV
jgi:hypothetical protein|tara:strand:- start:118 stop:471 length:354 start_codon:yes stop_codon:yes gene_type:complete